MSSPPVPQPESVRPARAAASKRITVHPSRLQASCAISFLVHLVSMVALALIVQALPPESPFRGLVAYANGESPLDQDGPEFEKIVLAEPGPIESDAVSLDRSLGVPSISGPEMFDSADGGDPSRDARGVDIGRPVFGNEPGEATDWLAAIGEGTAGGGLDSRAADARTAAVQRGGGTPMSERAVERGLRWLAVHQRDDGSWSFDLRLPPCRGECRNPGSESSATAATAICLLPFLGAGYTHRQGEYQDVVKRGLYYLLQHARVTPDGHDLQDGTMYAQGLSAIALCEAYALTDDAALKDAAQGALRFVCHAQHQAGGWRYTPGQPGDTTVTGWQLMALKSGETAKLEVPRSTIYLAQRFLDSVQSEDGSLYGYLTAVSAKEGTPGAYRQQEQYQTTTAIGLLCRIYTGWRRDHPGMRRGVARLSQWGPSKDNLYYNYYATQVLFHWQGNEWEKWNRKLREFLIATQATEGHEAGSWYFAGGRGDRAGRLYNTAMAVMTLEVYYRYMPLYGPQAFEGEFR